MDLDPVKNSSGIKKWFSLINSDADFKAYSLSVVLRDNGHTDFYYNFSLVEQNKEVVFEDINYDFNRIYLRRRGKNREDIIYKIN